MSKQDHLRLCNENGLPFQDFVAGWCSRCFQPECTRSLHGKSKFEDRVLNWQDRLFNHVPRLDPSDPRYLELSTKKFLAVVPENYGQWADPRDLGQVPQQAIVPVIPADPVPEPPPAPSVPALPIPSLEPPLPSPTPPPQQPALANTVAKPKQMIGGHELKPPQPVLDPWQPVQPLKPGDTLVKPGVRIKLGR